MEQTDTLEKLTENSLTEKRIREIVRDEIIKHQAERAARYLSIKTHRTHIPSR